MHVMGQEEKRVGPEVREVARRKRWLHLAAKLIAASALLALIAGVMLPSRQADAVSLSYVTYCAVFPDGTAAANLNAGIYQQRMGELDIYETVRTDFRGCGAFMYVAPGQHYAIAVWDPTGKWLGLSDRFMVSGVTSVPTIEVDRHLSIN